MNINKKSELSQKIRNFFNSYLNGDEYEIKAYEDLFNKQFYSQAMLPERSNARFSFFEDERELMCVGGLKTSDAFFYCAGQFYDFKRFADYVWSMHGIAVGYSVNNGLVLMRLPSKRSGANYEKTMKFCFENVNEESLTESLVPIREFVSGFDIFDYFNGETLPKGYVDSDSRFYSAETVEMALESMGYRIDDDGITIIEMLAEVG